MRLAWFSPVPPVRSGIATVSAELVQALAGTHEIDVFVDEPVARAHASFRLKAEATPKAEAARKAEAAHDRQADAPVASAFRRKVAAVRSAHDFVWEHQQRPYDLTVYQLGNSSHHDYQWPYLFRYPGLTVLHDVHLHHARAATLLRERRAADYRAEFAANEPQVSPDAAELAIAGFDSHIYYQFPFVRQVVSASRVIAVHSRVIRDRLRDEFPDAAIEHIRLGHGTPLSADEAAQARAVTRHRLGIANDVVLFGCFGGLTPDKRIPQILGAFEAVLRRDPSARLLLAGSPAAHYDIGADVQQRSLASQVSVIGYLDTDEALTAHIAACDATLNLRWPTARELSGPWLRCLAAGRATVVIDLAQTADVPALDPRSWTKTTPGDAPAVTIAVDITDEDHSLRLAMVRLAADPALRDSLGAAARAWWDREHAPAAMLNDYQRVMSRAAQLAAPDPPLPAHLRDAESGRLDAILAGFGVPVPWSKI